LLPLLRLLHTLRHLQALDGRNEHRRPDEHTNSLAELLEVHALLAQVAEQPPQEVRVEVRGRG
jgi:hypothetical protein